MTKLIVDWERVESDFRAGLLSIRQIAAGHGISDMAIRKRAKRDDWARDLEAKVRAKAGDLVRMQVVRTEVRKTSEREIVDTNAALLATIQLSHRADVRRSREVTGKLRERLSVLVDQPDHFERLGELLADGTSDKLGEMYRKVIALPGLIDSVKRLAEAERIQIQLEREVCGIGKGVADRPGVEDMIDFLDRVGAEQRYR
jgi:hypothetical protein